ncbi:MAG: lytic transglycosylase domain-containing protein [Elusimicrobia bacterium]|nr:lytic transglycosylase domain-containing protein [Elusimicrobiota bacterium]
MKTLSTLFLGLILTAPLTAGAQSFSQLPGAMDYDAAAAPVSGPVPVAGATENQPAPKSVDFLVRPAAEHEPGAQLFNITGSADKAAPGASSSKIPYFDLAKAEAAAQGVDLSLVLAIIQKESSFDPKARSKVGARGLMQLMPATARWLGLKNTKQITVPAVNIKYGVKYLKYLWDEFADMPSGDLSAADIKKRTSQMAIAAYNAGGGNVRKYDGVPPFKETLNYVDKVTEYFNAFEKLLAEIPVP